MRKDDSKNSHGYKVAIVCMSGWSDYERSKRIISIEIISAAYPWQAPFKLAQHIVDRYKLAVVDRERDNHPIITSSGLIFRALLPSFNLQIFPYFEVVFTGFDC